MGSLAILQGAGGLREKDEGFHSRDAHQGISAPRFLAYSVLLLVDCHRILPVLLFKEEIKYPPLPGYLSRKITLVLSLLHLAPVSLLRSYFRRED